MQTVIATIGLFGLVVAAMAVGVMFSGRPLRGSCGGMGKDCSCSAEERQGCPKAKPA